MLHGRILRELSGGFSAFVLPLRLACSALSWPVFTIFSYILLMFDHVGIPTRGRSRRSNGRRARCHVAVVAAVPQEPSKQSFQWPATPDAAKVRGGNVSASKPCIDPSNYPALGFAFGI